jgi:hypothetical protein
MQWENQHIFCVPVDFLLVFTWFLGYVHPPFAPHSSPV